MDAFEAVETTAENHVGGYVTTTDSARIRVDVHGRGRPVLLVHGWTMSSRFWRRQLPLSDHCQLITMDLRGHGRSPAVLRGNTMSRYARDVRDVIRALRLKNVFLAGWSLGGSVVMDYWKQYGADRVSALGVIESSPAPLAEAPWNVHRYHGKTMDEIRPHLAAMTKNRERHGTLFINSMFLDGNAPSHAMKWMLNEHLAVSDETALSIYEDYLQQDYTGVLATVTVPTIAIYGRSKNMCFGPSTGRFVAGSIPNSRFVILEKSGHMPFYEEPEEFNTAIMSFLNS